MFFTQRRGKCRATIITFIDGLPLSLGPRQTLPGLKAARGLLATNKGIASTGSHKGTL